MKPPWPVISAVPSMCRDVVPVTVYAVTPVPCKDGPVALWSWYSRWPHNPPFFLPPATPQLSCEPLGAIHPPPVTKSPSWQPVDPPGVGVLVGVDVGGEVAVLVGAADGVLVVVAVGVLVGVAVGVLVGEADGHVMSA